MNSRIAQETLHGFRNLPVEISKMPLRGDAHRVAQHIVLSQNPLQMRLDTLTLSMHHIAKARWLPEKK